MKVRVGVCPGEYTLKLLIKVTSQMETLLYLSNEDTSTRFQVNKNFFL